MMKRLVVLASVLSALGITTAWAQTVPFPDDLKSNGVLRIGVRCDQPPYGFQDEQGQFAGVEVQIARQLAAWALGSPEAAALTCVSAENRIPQLQSRKVDLLVATLGVTPERARVIDFSIPYRWDGADTVVPKDSPVQTLADLSGKNVLVLKGTTQAKWLEDNMPEIKTLRLNSTADAVQSLAQGRADAVALDGTMVATLTEGSTALRRLDQLFAVSDAAIGIRKGDDELKAWVDDSLRRMKSEHLFEGWVREYAKPEAVQRYLRGFVTERPSNP